MGLEQRDRVRRSYGRNNWKQDDDDACDGQTVQGEGSVERSCGPTNRKRIEGGAEQGERAYGREALVTKARRRRSGGRAATVNGLTRGGLALRLKG